MVPSKILGRCLQVKRITRPDGVVDALARGSVQARQMRLSHVAIVELLRVRALGPLHMPVELGRAGPL